MSARFKLGDRVRIVASTFASDNLQAGKVGVVKELLGPGAYGVRMDEPQHAPSRHPDGGWTFFNDELEAEEPQA